MRKFITVFIFFLFIGNAFPDDSGTHWKRLKAVGYMNSDTVTVFWNSCVEGYLKGLEAQKYTLEDISKINGAWVGNYCYNLTKQISKHPESATDKGLKRLYDSAGFTDKLKNYINNAVKEADKKFNRYNKVKTSKNNT
ncbi:MAG: hypothetical protein WCQ47_04635 [bacterium]